MYIMQHADVISRRFVDEDLGLYVSEAVLLDHLLQMLKFLVIDKELQKECLYSRIYDDVTFTFMVDRDYKVMKFFESWTAIINPLT